MVLLCDTIHHRLYILFCGLIAFHIFRFRSVSSEFDLENALNDILIEEAVACITLARDSTLYMMVKEEFTPEDSHIQKTFNDIGSLEEFWQWFGGVLLLLDPSNRNKRSETDAQKAMIADASSTSSP